MGRTGQGKAARRVRPCNRRASRFAPYPTIGTSVEQLDFGDGNEGVASGCWEIVLEKPIKTLMMIAVEHAGAERGLLILSHGEELRIAEEAGTGRDGVEVQRQPASVTPSALHRRNGAIGTNEPSQTRRRPEPPNHTKSSSSGRTAIARP
jgi:hypothetical protein